MKRSLITGLVALLLAATAWGQGYNASRTFTTATTATADVGLYQGNHIIYHMVSWQVTGSPGGCTVAIDSSPDGSAWTTGGIIANQTCTSNGTSVVTSGNAAYVRIDVTALTGGSSPTITANYTGWAYNPQSVGNGVVSANSGSAGALAYYAAAGGSVTVAPTTGLIENPGVSFTIADPLIVVPVGSSASPNIQATGANATTGLYFLTTAMLWDATGTASAYMGNNGFEVGDASVNGYSFSQTAGAQGTAGAKIQVVGSGTTEFISPNVPIFEGAAAGTTGACKFSAVTLVATSNPGTLFCTLPLPNIAEPLFVDCKFSYVDGGAYTLGLDYKFSQAPTVPTFSANVLSSNTNTATEATITTAGTTENTIITGAAPAGTGTYLASIYGNFTSSATAGSLTLQGFASSASGITVSGMCRVN